MGDDVPPLSVNAQPPSVPDVIEVVEDHPGDMPPPPCRPPVPPLMIDQAEIRRRLDRYRWVEYGDEPVEHERPPQSQNSEGETIDLREDLDPQRSAIPPPPPPPYPESFQEEVGWEGEGAGQTFEDQTPAYMAWVGDWSAEINAEMRRHREFSRVLEQRISDVQTELGYDKFVQKFDAHLEQSSKVRNFVEGSVAQKLSVDWPAMQSWVLEQNVVRDGIMQKAVGELSECLFFFGSTCSRALLPSAQPPKQRPHRRAQK